MTNGNTSGGVDTSLINQSLKAIAQSMGQVAAAITSVFTITGGTAATASAGSATLPSAPAAFGIVTIDGVAYKIALYLP